jgi:hypothetical protein
MVAMLLDIAMLPRCTARDSAVGWRATCYGTLPTIPRRFPFFGREGTATKSGICCGEKTNSLMPQRALAALKAGHELRNSHVERYGEHLDIADADFLFSVLQV